MSSNEQEERVRSFDQMVEAMTAEQAASYLKKLSQYAEIDLVIAMKLAIIAEWIERYTIQLKPYERHLVGILLRLANEEFVNHGCNDIDLIAYGFSTEQRQELLQQYEIWNGSPEDFDPERTQYAMDYALMAYFADRIEPQQRKEE